jgi:hypothetical protein
LTDVRASIAAQIDSLKGEIKLFYSSFATKATSTETWGKQFRERKGDFFERNKDAQSNVMARVVAVKNQIMQADENVAAAEKTASRIAKSIPAPFLRDPELIKLTAGLQPMIEKYKKDIADAKAVALHGNAILEGYCKGAPARPAGAPSGQASSAQTGTR